MPARSAGRSGRGAHLQTHLRRINHQNQPPPFRTARPSEVGVPSRPRASSPRAGRGFAALSGSDAGLKASTGRTGRRSCSGAPRRRLGFRRDRAIPPLVENWTARGATRRCADRRSAFQAVPALLRRGQDAVSRPSRERAAYCQARKKQMAANRRFAAGDFGGKCERGLPPFTINNDQSELAAARRQRRAREFRLPARSAGRSGRGAHLQTHLRRINHQNQPPPFRTARPKGGSPPNTPTTNHPPESATPLPDRST